MGRKSWSWPALMGRQRQPRACAWRLPDVREALAAGGGGVGSDLIPLLSLCFSVMPRSPPLALFDARNVG